VVARCRGALMCGPTRSWCTKVGGLLKLRSTAAFRAAFRAARKGLGAFEQADETIGLGAAADRVRCLSMSRDFSMIWLRH
jgi:hypothetical protein